MALRDQPYIPLYVQDFMTDEKLMECTAESTGVYIRLMCVLHKQETYGKILLKQKYKQNVKQEKNFALLLVKFLPYDLLTIERSLIDLIDNDVIQIEDDWLMQSRMVIDGEISLKRADAGSKGGKTTQKKNEKNKDFASSFAKAKTQAKVKANSENEYEYEIEVVIDYLNSVLGANYKTTTKETGKLIKARIAEGFGVDDFKKAIDNKYKEWQGTDMAVYLRPSTLFGNKFEGYLNALEKPQGKNEQPSMGFKLLSL